ncbi:MAG: DUF2079 domain-containing protein [Dehalococcoidia bacterium]|nr:DUF2079 domain-containing protein [Dehalococcoidia bacterium]
MKQRTKRRPFWQAKLIGLSASPLAPWIIPFALVTAYIVYFSILVISERAAIYNFDEDLAIYDQIVWNTAHLRPFASSLIQHANNMLGDHFSPIVGLFAPAYWVWPSANLLLVFQTMALALAALPLFAIARQHLGSRPATLVVAAFLVYPAVHNANVFQFHEITLSPLPLAVALLGVERGSKRLFWVGLAVAFMVKEEMAFAALGIGLLWWLRRRQWRMAVVTAVVATAFGFLTIGLLLPSLNAALSDQFQGYYYVRRFTQFGGSIPEIAWTMLTSPGLVWGTLTAPDRLEFLIDLFVPLALLPLIGWEFILAALPVFSYLLLADADMMHSIHWDYTSPLLPFIFFACVLGIKRLAALGGKRRTQALAMMASCLVLAASLGGSYLLGTSPFARDYDKGAWTVTEHTMENRRFIAMIPSNAPISASRNLLSWFSQRERVYRWPEIHDADYILLDWRDLRYPGAYMIDGNGEFDKLLSSPDYRLTDAAGGTLLFVRGDPLVWPGEWPQKPTRFGDSIELLGYRLQPTLSGPGLEVTFYWRALAMPAKPYSVFVHLLSPDGQELIAQSDSYPMDGLYPTNIWEPGRVVPDTHVNLVKNDLPSTNLRIRVGLYDPYTGARLPITSRGLPGGADFVEIIQR